MDNFVPKSVTAVSFAKNKIKAFPNDLGFLTQLLSLNLSRTEVSLDAGGGLQMYKLTKLEHLNLLATSNLPAPLQLYCGDYELTQIVLRRISRQGARAAARTILAIRRFRCPPQWIGVDKNVFTKVIIYYFFFVCSSFVSCFPLPHDLIISLPLPL